MKKDKQDFEDDQRTIASMNVEGMPWYISKEAYKTHVNVKALDLTKGERRAMFWAVVSSMVPITAVLAIVSFLTLLFLDIFWLS